MTGHVLVVDQGTTSTRSIIFGPGAALVAMAQEEFPQIFPQGGWVEHDPELLWRTTLSTARQALSRAGVEPSALAGLRDHQPARDDARLGANDWPAYPQCHRLAGSSNGAAVRRS